MFREESMFDVGLLPGKRTMDNEGEIKKLGLHRYMKLNDVFAVTDLVTPPTRSTRQAFSAGEKSFEEFSVDFRSQSSHWWLRSSVRLRLRWVLCRSSGSDFIGDFSCRSFGQFIQICFIGILICNNECRTVGACHLRRYIYVTSK